MLSLNDKWPVFAAGVRIFELTDCCLDVDGVTGVSETDGAICGIVSRLSTGRSDAGEANM